MKNVRAAMHQPLVTRTFSKVLEAKSILEYCKPDSDPARAYLHSIIFL
jgi:hypothetical protein